jgi:translin
MIKIRQDFDKKREIREEVITLLRESLINSKSAINAVHSKKRNTAQLRLKKAKEKIEQAKVLLERFPDLHVGMLYLSFQEFTEASILYEVIFQNNFTSPEELGVLALSYLMGIADSIGEFRRSILDSLRRDEVEEAERTLEIMEKLFAELAAMESAQSLESNLRRKIDVARRILEVTRGDVTTEIRRERLKKVMSNFEKKLNNRLSK